MEDQSNDQTVLGVFIQPGVSLPPRVTPSKRLRINYFHVIICIFQSIDNDTINAEAQSFELKSNILRKTTQSFRLIRILVFFFFCSVILLCYLEYNAYKYERLCYFKSPTKRFKRDYELGIEWKDLQIRHPSNQLANSSGPTNNAAINFTSPRAKCGDINSHNLMPFFAFISFFHIFFSVSF